MKQKNLYQTCIEIAAIAVLVLAAIKLSAQTYKVPTAVGAITFTQSDAKDEICLAWGQNNGELSIKYLDQCGTSLEQKVAAAAKMADDGAVAYSVFLKENEVKDSAIIREYHKKCRILRKQFLKVVPERAFVELQHITDITYIR